MSAAKVKEKARVTSQEKTALSQPKRVVPEELEDGDLYGKNQQHLLSEVAKLEQCRGERRNLESTLLLFLSTCLDLLYHVVSFRLIAISYASQIAKRPATRASRKPVACGSGEPVLNIYPWREDLRVRSLVWLTFWLLPCPKSESLIDPVRCAHN
eukprot:4713616-Amphidinium_carterae.1